MEDGRLDKLLWALRFYKTRVDAADACEAGHVRIGEHVVRPGRKVHAGEVVNIRLPDFTRTVRVDALPRSRVGAALVSQYATDLTPPAEYERAKQAGIERAQARARFSEGGRPTKKDRRDLSRLLELE